ncbi:MAG: glycosyltransferase family 2 protein [Elusimicrobia bacterium]|nr:glycosyltransferase family 2 protein [Elusimicrobiota bacterium]
MLVHPSASSEKPRVSIVIPNWNGMPFVKNCIRSAAEQIYAPPFEIIFVDNGNSRDGSREHVEQNYPQVQVVRLPVNRKYTGGLNAGIAQSRGEFILTVGNDNVLDKDLLRRLMEVIEKDEQIGCVGAQACDPGTQAAQIKNRKMYTLNILLQNTYLEMPAYWTQEPCELFYIDTNVALFRRSAAGPGPFDEEYHFYYDEITFTWLFRLRGYKNVHVPAALTQHLSNATISRESQFNRYFAYHKNRLMAMFTFYQISTLLKLFPLLLLHEIAFLFWPGGLRTKYRQFLPKLAGYLWLLTHPRVLMRKRNHVQTQRQVPDRNYCIYMSCQTTSSRNALSRRIGQIVHAYLRMAGLPTVEDHFNSGKNLKLENLRLSPIARR